MSLRYDLTYDIVTTSPSLLKRIILKPRPLIASQFEQFQHTNFENTPENYDSEQSEDPHFISGVIVSFFFFYKKRGFRTKYGKNKEDTLLCANMLEKVY